MLSKLEAVTKELTDVTSLIQAMESKKLKLFTNGYIAKLRSEKHKKIRFQVSPFSNLYTSSGTKVSGKLRYIAQLPLRAIMDHSLNEIEEQKEDIHLECNESWPICAFDHTFKNRRPECFKFRSKEFSEESEWINSYFEPNPEEFEPMKKKIRKEEDMLLIQREKHYCFNKEFTKKINDLLMINNSCEDAFPPDFIDVNVKEPWKQNMIIEKYLEYIIKYVVPSSIPDLTSKESTTVNTEDPNKLTKAINEELKINNGI